MRLGVVFTSKVVDTVTTSQTSDTTLQEDSGHISTKPRQLSNELVHVRTVHSGREWDQRPSLNYLL